MGYQEHVCSFLNRKSLKSHQESFLKDSIIYLSIINDFGVLAGYFILLKESDNKTIQLKRILVGINNQGIGQESIVMIENHCISVLNVSRIWLDVYEENSKAKHIYAKLKYKQFKSEVEGSRIVLFYEKLL